MRKLDRNLFPWLALIVIGAASFLTLAMVAPTGSLPIDAPATNFSAERAMRDLEAIAREPHPMGISQARADVRDYLLQEIRALGLEPQVQGTFGVRVDEQCWVLAGAVENVLVRLPGSAPEGAVALMSHYDTAPGVPGAVDSGSGVVTVLELLRALNAGPQLRHDVIFVLTDGEEPGTFGSHAFVAQHPWLQDIRLAINMDQFRMGPPMLIRASPGNGLWVQALARTAARPAYVSLPFHLFPGGESDLLPFTQAGIPGADIMTAGSYPENHTSLDLPELVDHASLQRAGEQMLALVRYLGDQPTLEASTPDQSFFPLLGRLVHYPTSWATPLAVAAGLCFVGTLYYGLRKRSLTWQGVSLGLLALLLGLAIIVGVANLLWRGIQALHPEYGYSVFRPHLSDDYLYAIGFIALALSVTVFSIAIARRKITSLDLAAGALAFWLPGTIAATVLVPATSCLATWILLSASLALLLALAVQSRDGAWTISGLGFLVSAILATFLAIPSVYIAFLGTGFTMLSLPIGAAALWMGSMMPALDWITSRKRWPLPIAALLAALGFVLAGHLLVGRDSPPPLANPIGYWLDTHQEEAYWITFSGGYRLDAHTTREHLVAVPEELDERQSNLIVNPTRRPYTELMAEAPPYSVLTSEAPMLNLPGPELEVVDDAWVGGRRVVRVRVTTSMDDRLYVIVPQETPVLAITIPYNERAELPACEEEFVLRFDGMPVEGFEMDLEFGASGQVQFLLVEERTGLPSFPGLSTEPLPGTMRSPGEFYQGIPTDFTAIHRAFTVP